MEKRKSLILHFDSLDVLDELSEKQTSDLFIAIRDYNKGKEPKLDGLMKAIFIPFKNQFDRDLEKYNKKCKVNKNNGKKGGRPKETQENPVGYFETQENPEKPYNDNKNNSNNKKDKDKDKIISNDIIEHSSSIIKTDNRNSNIDEMQKFIKEQVEQAGYIYKRGGQERNRIQNILTGKDINEIAKSHNMTIHGFVGNIFNLSTKLDFRNGKINNAETFYKHYAKIYNDGLSLKRKKEAVRQDTILYTNEF